MKSSRFLCSLALFMLLNWNAAARAQDTNFWIFVCFGQSNMEGFPGIEEQDKEGVDPRFQVFAAVDFPNQNRTKNHWYPAVPPLCRPNSGISPADYFGRAMVSSLPPTIRIGVISVAVAGCKIELFDKENFKSYATRSNTAPWMKMIIETYGGNPYQHLVETAKLAQKDGVIKGILLHQGESNNNDKEWPEKVKAIYESLLRDLNLKAENAPLIAGELVNSDQNGACASMNTIIAELPKTIPTAHVVSSKGCKARRDRLHFAPAGYRELGKRYAEVTLSALRVETNNQK
jgi:alpha-L-fucosidase 2